MQDTQQRIKEQVTGNRVVLFMKGTPQFPQCGFSALAVQVLNACGVNEFSSVGDLPAGFPPGSSRNTIRVGVTIWLPLLGNYVAERPNGRSGRSSS